MTHAFEKKGFRAFAAAVVCATLMVAGCQETYEPAAYKAAPRVDSADSENSNAESKGRARLPDITDWTSPEALRGPGSYRGPSGKRGYRGIGGYRGISGYRGIGGYRGISNRAYDGIGGYRGYGDRAYRGYGQSKAYRGYGQQRAYRGN